MAPVIHLHLTILPLSLSLAVFVVAVLVILRSRLSRPLSMTVCSQPIVALSEGGRGLPTGDNKSTLQDGLRESNADRKAWSRTVVVKRRKHEGRHGPRVIEGRVEKLKRTTAKQEWVQWHEFKASRFRAKCDTLQYVSSYEGSVDNRTEGEKAAVLPWCAEILRRYPYEPPTKPLGKSASASKKLPPTATTPRVEVPFS